MKEKSKNKIVCVKRPIFAHLDAQNSKTAGIT